MVLTARFGVIKEADVARSDPPDGASYHWYVPPGAEAVRVALVPEQVLVPAAVGAAGGGVTVTVTAVLGPGHPAIVVCT